MKRANPIVNLKVFPPCPTIANGFRFVFFRVVFFLVGFTLIPEMRPLCFFPLCFFSTQQSRGTRLNRGWLRRVRRRREAAAQHAVAGWQLGWLGWSRLPGRKAGSPASELASQPAEPTPIPLAGDLDPAAPAWPSGPARCFSNASGKVPGSNPGAAISAQIPARVQGEQPEVDRGKFPSELAAAGAFLVLGFYGQ